MKQVGLKHSEIDIQQFPEKFFYTFRKSHTVEEHYFTRYHPLNLINKHHTRWATDMYT